MRKSVVVKHYQQVKAPKSSLDFDTISIGKPGILLALAGTKADLLPHKERTRYSSVLACFVVHIVLQPI
jgi:hypothetical protein